MGTTKTIDLKRHVWEGWRAGDFIDSLAPELELIMQGRSWRKPFASKPELAAWCRDNLPIRNTFRMLSAISPGSII